MATHGFFYPKLEKKLEDNDGIKKWLNNIGLIYLDLDDLENALANLKKSTAIDSDEINNLGAMVNIGIIYNKQEKYNAALKIFKNALNVYQKTEFTVY